MRSGISKESVDVSSCLPEAVVVYPRCQKQYSTNVYPQLSFKSHQRTMITHSGYTTSSWTHFLPSSLMIQPQPFTHDERGPMARRRSAV